MLYLLPNILGDLPSHTSELPTSVDLAVAELTHLIAESEKEGRRFLSRFAFTLPKTWREVQIHLLNEHSQEGDKKALLAEIRRGGVWGLISDCGMPCLADPGADLVLAARQAGVPIQTFPGPSSPLLALVLSGLGGQHFTFHGYLPKEEGPLSEALRKIERTSRLEGSTHLFIETPYRNRRLFDKMMQALDNKTLVCIACALRSPGEWVQTLSTLQWKERPPPDIQKLPCIFVLRA